MIINIYGPSGSGKTTFIRNLLMSDSLEEFYRRHSHESSKDNLNKKISISLMPIPLFRGTIGEFFDIFCIKVDNLFTLNKELKDLAKSIFRKINSNSIDEITSRRLETLSAGEIRRLFILKSILVDSNIMVIDEPFSNSDQNLWNKIYEAINLNERSIILSHLSLQNYFKCNKDIISIHINKVKMEFK